MMSTLRKESLDSELVKLAREGDREAFRELVERYQRRVLSVARSVMGRQEDAEDVVQESFLKAFRNLDSFKGESSFYTWLYRIVMNMAIDERRKRYRHVESHVGDGQILSNLSEEQQLKDGLGNRVFNPEIEFERGELRQQLREAISQLSPVHRAVIILREVDGCSYEEMSRVMQCSRGTVMSRLHHARKKLQQALSSSGKDGKEKVSEES